MPRLVRCAWLNNDSAYPPFIEATTFYATSQYTTSSTSSPASYHGSESPQSNTDLNLLIENVSDNFVVSSHLGIDSQNPELLPTAKHVNATSSPRRRWCLHPQVNLGIALESLIPNREADRLSWGRNIRSTRRPS